MINADKVIPWGRSFKEYQQMFALNKHDLDNKILSVGDGPASFNAQMHKLGRSVTSVDPIYTLSKEDILHRILEVKDDLLGEVARRESQYVWEQIKDVNELEHVRMEAMQLFLEDFENGLAEERYLAHTLPQRLPFADQQFKLVLSSHFLLLYEQLGFEFHEQSIREMLRVGKEVRIFPVKNLNQQPSTLVHQLISAFEDDYDVSLTKVNYEFQKGANQMMVFLNDKI
jgi:hypothetical protein